jgi:hypothetical protein
MHRAFDKKTGDPVIVADKKSRMQFVEMPMTGCTEANDTSSGQAPYTCPRGAATPNPGYLSTTPESVWETREQVNGTRTYLRKLKNPSKKYLEDPSGGKGSKKGGAEFWVEGCRTKGNNDKEKWCAFAVFWGGRL